MIEEVKFTMYYYFAMLSLNKVNRFLKIIILGLIAIVPCGISRQEKFTGMGKAQMKGLTDVQVIEKISSQNREEATQAFNETFKRGARTIPLLMAYKGDRRFYFGKKMGQRTGDFKIEPLDVTNVDTEEIEVETVEIAALYLISSFYFGTLEFAHSALLEDTTIPVDERVVGNTQGLLNRAWNATEQWVPELKEKGLAFLKRDAQRDPLNGSGTRFYGTTRPSPLP